MKRVLLTGATGFVGANLCRRLLREGHEVHCLLRPGHNPWRIADVQEHLRIHVVDVADLPGLDPVMQEIRPEWIFHLGAYGAYPWQTDVQQMARTNILGTINLVESGLKAGFEVLINTGSSSEYGFKDHAPAPTESLDPNSHYAVTKASATLYCRYTATRRQANITTLRLYSVYGPFEDGHRFIPSLILQGLKGNLPPLVDGQVARDYIHVSDVEQAFLHLAQRTSKTDGQVYNVGTGVQTSIAQAVQRAQDVFKLGVAPRWGTMAKREWDTATWVADNRTLMATGWKPAVSFKDGFDQTVEWFRSGGALLEHYAGL